MFARPESRCCRKVAMREEMNAGRAGGQGDAMASWAALRDKILRALEEMECLLEEVRKTGDGSSGLPSRHLVIHPIARKRVVLDFLSWCWCENAEHSYFGPNPQTLESEYGLFRVWRDALPSADKKRTAFEIDTLPEYTACREGARKAFRDRWAVLQAARAHWVGTDKKGKTTEPRGTGRNGG